MNRILTIGSVELEISRMNTNLNINRTNLKSIEKSLIGVFFIEMEVVFNRVLEHYHHEILITLSTQVRLEGL